MLTEITGDPAHKLIQSMFFDKNMATEPHQDNYYLDSFPPGRLLGCWFALEDIHVDAGRFFVIPGSHRHRFELTRDEVRVNELYLRKVARYVRENRSRIFAPGLRKGDVLFWNAMTIHGSLKTADRRFSRRSLTAHYMPPAALFGRLHIRLPIENESMVHDGMSLWRYSLADVEQPPLVHRLATRAYRRIFTFSAQPELYRLGKPFAGIAKRIRMRLRDPRRE
jgi:phytanoyl-CoA hydroxylase